MDAYNRCECENTYFRKRSVHLAEASEYADDFLRSRINKVVAGDWESILRELEELLSEANQSPIHYSHMHLMVTAASQASCTQKGIYYAKCATRILPKLFYDTSLEARICWLSEGQLCWLIGIVKPFFVLWKEDKFEFLTTSGASKSFYTYKDDNVTKIEDPWFSWLPNDVGWSNFISSSVNMLGSTADASVLLERIETVTRLDFFLRPLFLFEEEVATTSDLRVLLGSVTTNLWTNDERNLSIPSEEKPDAFMHTSRRDLSNTFEKLLHLGYQYKSCVRDLFTRSHQTKSSADRSNWPEVYRLATEIYGLLT